MKPTACYCGMRRDIVLLRLADELDTLSLAFMDGLVPVDLARHYAGQDWEELLKRKYEIPVALNKGLFMPEFPPILKAMGLRCEKCGRLSLDYDDEGNQLFCRGETTWGGGLYANHNGCATIQAQAPPPLVYKILYAYNLALADELYQAGVRTPEPVGAMIGV
ncbi:MAG: hypothetical protein ACFFD1_01015 [Candidatus Thorarchaeota archaeon]